MTKRLYKKRYKNAVRQIADKISAGFSDKKDKKRWIGKVKNLRMQDIKKQRTAKKKGEK